MPRKQAHERFRVFLPGASFTLAQQNMLMRVAAEMLARQGQA